uniref:ODAD1 central coiled coil region domain-containing protein n=1 Tax=Timema poppense TaxID=170557 RepID=A0A7R9DHA7_TIMPO|nr:unnamed protein product [Timema poppensis]
MSGYRKIVGKIQGLTNMKSLAGICELLTKQEEDTHRLYNDVSDTRSTVLHLREQVRESYREMKLETEKLQLRLDHRRKIGQDLTNELEARTSELREVHERYQRNQGILNKLMSWMEEMCVLLRCDKAPLLALLGEHSSVSLLNWGMYMRLIERRTLDIINILYCREGHPPSISGIKRSPPPVIVPPRKARLEAVPLCEAAPTQPCSLCSEEYMLKDEAVAPLSSKQLTTRILQLREDDTSKKRLLHNLCDCSHPESRKLFRDILLSQ